MDKKDIYEHLAKIYLDASSTKNNKAKRFPPIFKKIIIVIIFFAFGLSGALFLKFQKSKLYSSETALVLVPDIAKINFHFDPARKETFSLNLKNLNLTRYSTLAFSAKKANYQDNISLRVEFTNVFKEKSEVYFKDIPHNWQDYKVNFSGFKTISDWSEMANLTFTIEEWNVREKIGVVYIDNVRVLK